MRHGNRIKKLGRTSAHRKATMAALSNALIAHKRIRTTYEKAKALRGFVEPLINRAKSDTVHNRRQVFRYLQDKESVKTLFGEVAEKIADRPGGYTRVIKLGRRQGDGAEVALIELVDYNDVRPDGSGGAADRKKTRRGARRKKSDAAKPTVAATATAVEVAEELADEMEETVEEVVEETAAEATVEEVVKEVEEVADVAVETTDKVVDEAAEVVQEAEEAPESTTVGTVEEVEAVVEEPETESEVTEGPVAEEEGSSDETAEEEEDDEKK